MNENTKIFLSPWKRQFIIGFAIFQIICAVVTIFTLDLFCFIAGFLHINAALIVLAIEKPSCVHFAYFRIIGKIFHQKSIEVKFFLYIILAIVPCLLKCIGLFFFLAFITSAIIPAFYGVALIDSIRISDLSTNTNHSNNNNNDTNREIGKEVDSIASITSV